MSFVTLLYHTSGLNNTFISKNEIHPPKNQAKNNLFFFVERPSKHMRYQWEAQDVLYLVRQDLVG